jgi:pilus assembly protein CpaB
MVLVASHALSAGSIISPGDVKAKPAAGSVPVGAALADTDVLGRVIVRSYAAKETILRDDLRDVSTLGIAARVLPGQRAFSIRVGEDDIVGGFLQSGDHIDVFATIPGSVFPEPRCLVAARHIGLGGRRKSCDARFCSIKRANGELVIAT